MDRESAIFIAGHQGLAGAEILNNLKKKGYHNLITRTQVELDLTDYAAVDQFFKQEKPEYVFLAADEVGGIIASNGYSAEYLFQNLMIQTHVIHHSYLNNVKKLMFLGSTCIYPRDSPQPLKEEYLLTGELEYSNEPYSIANIAGIKMCDSYNLQYGTNFISVMLTNLYGPRDNFDMVNSPFLASIIRKIHLGKALEENDWEAVGDDLNRRPLDGLDGSQGKKEILETLHKYGITYKEKPGINGIENGQVSIEIGEFDKPLREFIWREEMANACVFLMENRNFKDIVSIREIPGQEIRNTHINIGTGRGISIAHLAEITKVIIGFRGRLYFNSDNSYVAPRKLTDVSKLSALGWKHSVELDEGIYRLYKWYKSSINYNYV